MSACEPQLLSREIPRYGLSVGLGQQGVKRDERMTVLNPPRSCRNDCSLPINIHLRMPNSKFRDVFFNLL
jgi:hypothetical protein